MIYEFVPFHLVAGEIAKNLKNHYEDVDLKDEYGIPDLDWDAYLQLSLANRCKALIVRTADKLIGYSVFLINNNINHKKVMEASSTGIFIDKKYRGKIFLEMINKSDEYLRKMGVQEIMYIFNDDRIGLLLQRADYKIKHKIWSKLI